MREDGAGHHAPLAEGIDAETFAKLLAGNMPALFRPSRAVDFGNGIGQTALNELVSFNGIDAHVLSDALQDGQLLHLSRLRHS